MRAFFTTLPLGALLVGSALFMQACQDAPLNHSNQEVIASEVAPYQTPTAEQIASSEIPVSPALSKTSAAGGGANLVSNGSFETNGGTNSNTFTDWTVWNQAGGSGNYYAQTGTSSPTFGFTVAAPTTGTYAAMSSQGGPGSHIIYQDVAIPSGGGTLSFDLFIGNRSTAFITPASLLYNAGNNQQFRMDIVKTTAAITDMGTGILQTVTTTPVGSALVSGYTTITASLDAHAGTTVRLRFAEVDNRSYFHAGIDNVRVKPRYVVDMDIKPGSSENPVNLKAKGKLTVAILSDDDCDATEIDLSTITLGDDSGTDTGIEVKNNGTLHASEEDVDGDGDTDVVMHFSIPDLVSNGDLTSSSTSLTLRGETNDGAEIIAEDVVDVK